VEGPRLKGRRAEEEGKWGAIWENERPLKAALSVLQKRKKKARKGKKSRPTD